jgi:DNA-binding transcriptional regulator YbjK
MDAALPRRQQVKRQNRRFILEAARKVFAERGYDAATVRDIINATPLAAGTFYNYFTSKEDVRRALDAQTAEALADLQAGFDDLRADIEAGIARGLFLPVDAAALAAALLAAASQMAERGEANDPAEATAAAALLFLRGVQPPI